MPAEVAMIMANIFLRAKRTRADRHETPDEVATLDQDLTAAGSVAVQRGPIGDLAVTQTATRSW